MKLSHTNYLYNKGETLNFVRDGIIHADFGSTRRWIISDGPSKPLGVVKLRYNALKLVFYNVAILRQRACFRQRLSLAAVSQATHQNGCGFLPAVNIVCQVLGGQPAGPIITKFGTHMHIYNTVLLDSSLMIVSFIKKLKQSMMHKIFS